MNWTTPREINEQLLRRWRRGDLLRARFREESIYPLSLRLRKPGAREIAEDFAAVADWVECLRRHSKAVIGHGYTVHWRTRRHRVHGANDMPDGVTVDSEGDALALIGKTRDAKRFSELAEHTLNRFPGLREWLVRYPLRALEYRASWPRLLDVLAWFLDHPRSGLYLRELDIPGVHSKFIESHRGVLSELLDAVLPVGAIDPDAGGVRGFNRRYGLRDKPSRIRFRLLDSSLAIQGLMDLEVPVEQFARLRLDVDSVFITENEINALAFPDFPRALVIFGLGYGVERLAGIDWLAERRLYYWGDIDTHGFAILHRLRRQLPAVRSLLMDRATLDSHRAFWGKEEQGKRFLGELAHLTHAEKTLYRQLRDDELGTALRLEQEHVSQGWLCERLAGLRETTPHNDQYAN